MIARQELMPLIDMPHENFAVGIIIFAIVCIAALWVGWAAGRA